MSNRIIASTTGALAIAAIAGPGSPAATAPRTSERVAIDTEGSATANASTDLSAVCPDPIVIQTDWWPTSDYGATYGLLGPDFEVDAENKIVSGPLVSGDAPTGIDIEIRAGGAAINFVPLRELAYVDESITFVFGHTDGQIEGWAETPLLSVVAPLEINPNMIMWDPRTYPEVETIQGLRDASVPVNVYPGVTFPDVLVSLGVLDAGQIDRSYDGSPDSFIASGGEIAQPGWATEVPYQYEHVFELWGRPVAYELVHDAGYQPYTENLAIRAGDLEELRPCLEAFVPVVQQSAIDYVTDPQRTDELIVDVVAQYDPSSTYDIALAHYASRTIAELGLIGNGPDDVIGNFDPDRVETLLEQMTEAGFDVAQDLTADQLYTNDFIDESIGLSPSRLRIRSSTVPSSGTLDNQMSGGTEDNQITPGGVPRVIHCCGSPWRSSSA